jgi:hypothetical protein
MSARSDKRGVDLISDVLPFGRLWYTRPDDAVGYAKFFSRSHDAVIRVYDETGNVIETHEHKGELKEWRPDSGSIAPLKVRPGSNQPEESAPRRRR